MKKTLTEDISRYDEKMRLRMDKKTVRSLALALVPACVIGAILWQISILVALPVAVPLFLAVLLFQIGMIDGMPLTEYAAAMLRQSGRKRLPYLYAREELPSPQGIPTGREDNER